MVEVRLPTADPRDRSAQKHKGVWGRRAFFLYKLAEVFNAQTYPAYLEQIAKSYFPRKTILIQDNASYHKNKDVWLWFRDQRKWLTVYNFARTSFMTPSDGYSKAFNAVPNKFGAISNLFANMSIY